MLTNLQQSFVVFLLTVAEVSSEMSPGGHREHLKKATKLAYERASQRVKGKKFVVPSDANGATEDSTLNGVERLHYYENYNNSVSLKRNGMSTSPFLFQPECGCDHLPQSWRDFLKDN